MEVGHDTSNWTGINLPFLQFYRNETAYYRGFVEVSGWVRPDVVIGAERLINRVFVNGVEPVCYIGVPMSDSLNMRDIEAVLGDDVLKPGKNLVAVEVKGGDYRIISIRASSKIGSGKFLLYCFYALPFVLLLVLGRRLLSSPLVAFWVFFIFCLVFVRPIFNDFNYWGGHDWDLNQGFFAVGMDSLLRLQFPLWNPYLTGGTPLLADPQSMVISPLMPLVMLFGVVTAVKLQLVVWYLIGLVGMFFVGREFKLNVFATYLVAFVFMFSSYYSIHMTEGHMQSRSLPLLPWAFLFYLRAAGGGRLFFAAGSGLMMAFMMFDGGIYTTVHTGIVLFLYAASSAASSLFGRRPFGEWVRPLRVLLVVFAAFLAFGAVKGVPMLELSREYDRPTTGDLFLYDGYTPNTIYYGFLGEIQKKYAPANLASFRSNWHEFGVYVGPVVVLLVAAVLVLYFESVWPLVFVAFVGLWLCFGTNSEEMALWSLLHELPVFSSMRTPSRFMLVVLFPVALLAGVMASKLEARRWWLGLLIASLVFYNLVAVDSPSLDDAFIIAPRLANATAFAQVNDHAEKIYVYSENYLHFLENKGIIDYGSLRYLSYVDTNVLPGGNQGYRGESYLISGNGSATISYFSPSRMRVDVDTAVEDTLVINQNFDGGWKAVGRQVFPAGGLIAVRVVPGDRRVLLYYSPASFKAGLFITLLAFLMAYHCVRVGGLTGGIRNCVSSFMKFHRIIFVLFIVFFIVYGIDFIQSGGFGSADASVLPPEYRGVKTVTHGSWNRTELYNDTGLSQDTASMGLYGSKRIIVKTSPLVSLPAGRYRASFRMMVNDNTLPYYRNVATLDIISNRDIVFLAKDVNLNDFYRSGVYQDFNVDFEVKDVLVDTEFMVDLTGSPFIITVDGISFERL